MERGFFTAAGGSTSFYKLWAGYALFCGVVSGVVLALVKGEYDQYRCAQKRAADEVLSGVSAEVAYARVAHIKRPKIPWIGIGWLISSVTPAVTYCWFSHDPQTASYAGMLAFAFSGGVLLLTILLTAPLLAYITSIPITPNPPVH